MPSARYKPYFNENLNMILRTKTLSLTALLALVVIATGCKPKEPKEPQVETSFFVLPLEAFGNTAQQIAETEKQRGSQVSDFDANTQTLKATAKFEDRNSEITYYFKDNKYIFALGQWTSTHGVQDFLNEIKKKTVALEEDKSSSTESEKVFFLNKDNRSIRLSVTVTNDQHGRPIGSYSFGSNDDGLYMPTRIKNLAEGSLFVPLIAQGIPQSLMWRYEELSKHGYIEGASTPERGVFAFNAGSDVITMVKYWFDVKTQTKLEECGIIFNKQNTPTQQQVEQYLTKLGFEKTTLGVQGTKTIVFYNRQMKSVAQFELEDLKKKEDFAPYLQFYYNDLTEKLPKEKVDIFLPILEFNKKPLAEILEEYKKQSYYKSFTEVKGIGYMISTSSPDFDRILLSSKDGTPNSKYDCCFLLAKDDRVINSPAIPKFLLANGFVERKGPALPTFDNKTLKVSSQIDVLGVSEMLCVSFEALEN